MKISKAKIEYKDVIFAYDSKKEKILKSLNLKIEGGDVIALVGHSGAGKTTIMNLIPRFYNVSSGDILIDDQSIYDISQYQTVFIPPEEDTHQDHKKISVIVII